MLSQCFLVQVFVATCQSLLEPLLSLRQELRRSEHPLSVFPKEQKKNVMMLLEAAIGSLFSQ